MTSEQNCGNIDRRDFLKTSSITAATAGLTPYFFWCRSPIAGPPVSDRLGIGCIGVGSMGMGDASEHAQFGDIIAVCDVDSRHALRAKHTDGVGNGIADTYEDYRRVLDRKDVDVVSIVTPDHWHVKIAIEALQAGKHVFCQKPLTLTLEENKLIRAACQKHADKVFFIGTQQRSERQLFLRAVNMVQKGLLGTINKIIVGIDGSPVSERLKVEVPPPELDWYMWLGPAPLVNYIPRRCHYEFRWWYEYSGGKFTDWGAHHVDIATWAIKHDLAGMGPIEIDGTDVKHPCPLDDRGMPTVDNMYNTSHDFNVICKFENGVEMHITSRGDNGVLFEGDKGRLFVNRGRIAGKPIEENWDKDVYNDDEVVGLYKGKPHEGHKNNFYRCIHEGGLPVSDVFSHVQTMNTCHLAAIAARLGRVIRWDPKQESILDDEPATRLASRNSRPGFEIAAV
jgi:predicted dehydrogenase